MVLALQDGASFTIPTISANAYWRWDGSLCLTYGGGSADGNPPIALLPPALLP